MLEQDYRTLKRHMNMALGHKTLESALRYE